MKKKENVIGKVIRKYRNYQNLSRRELAEKMHVSDGMIEEYEYGKTIPTVERLKQFHKALDIPFMEFFPDVTETEGYISKVEEKLIKKGIAEELENNPELIDAIKYYGKHSKNLKDIDLLKLFTKLSRMSKDKREMALEFLFKSRY